MAARPFLRRPGLGASAALRLLLLVAAVLAGCVAETRVSMETDLPSAAVGAARRYVREERVTAHDVMDLHFFLRHDPAAVEALREVSGGGK